MGILTGLGRLFGSSPPPDEALRAAVDRAIDAVDPRLRVVSDYQGRLAPAVGRALAYCEDLASSIPGPVDIGPRAFSSDPLVHALFAASDDIGDMLGRSREVRDFFADPANAAADEFFALLGMRRREKAVAGLALQGEVVQNGVPQRLLYFVDHTLGELGRHHELTRQRLRAAAFDSLAQGFATCVAELRREGQDARTAWAVEWAGTVTGRAGRRQALEERQRQAVASLAPERLLDAYAEWLAAPESRLYLKPTVLNVDRMGVIVDLPEGGGSFSTLSFPELIGRDRRHWIVFVARIGREDAQEALRRQQEANRYLII
jgi:hypothetical protein